MSDGPRVLVVDDDPQLREALSRALQLDGYDVSTASNGVKALDAISTERPDVMVLDVMMPYVGWLDVCCNVTSSWTACGAGSPSRRATHSRCSSVTSGARRRPTGNHA